MPKAQWCSTGALERTHSTTAHNAHAANSMTLINSLLSHATPQYWSELTGHLERLQTSRAVIRLMSSHTIEELSNSILDYQGNLVRILYNRKNRPVLAGPSGWGTENEEGQRTPVSGMQNSYGDGEQEAILDYIWGAAKAIEEPSESYGEGSAKSRGKTSIKDIVKWRKLGFDTEDLRREFEGTGMLGLECLVSTTIESVFWSRMGPNLFFQKQFVQSDPARFAQLVLEHNSRAPDRRCPIAKASNEVVEILSEHWNIFAPGCTCHHLPAFSWTPTNVQTRLHLNFVPAFPAELLQGACSGTTLFPSHVGR